MFGDEQYKLGDCHRTVMVEVVKPIIMANAADMSTDRTEANIGRIRTGSDCNFFENWRIRTGSD